MLARRSDQKNTYSNIIMLRHNRWIYENADRNWYFFHSRRKSQVKVKTKTVWEWEDSPPSIYTLYSLAWDDEQKKTAKYLL